MLDSRPQQKSKAFRVAVQTATLLGLSPLAYSAGMPCESLMGLSLPNATITSATAIPAGTFTPPGSAPINNLPAFCRVAGFATPTSDSHIGFEVWMPSSNWNKKYKQVGNGAFAGAVPFGALATGIVGGYATAGTDNGHQASSLDASWAIGHPEKVIDFGYRSLKETTDKAKAIFHAFYGHGPKRSYFMGCSDGGREGLMEAQRFPNDFDGIVAGAPANFWTHLWTGFVWNEQALHNDPASSIPVSKLPTIQAAVLAQCDALDGVSDGVLGDPRQCRFDPASLQCTIADSDNCLTAPQVTAVRKVMNGPRSPRTVEQIFPGYFPDAAAEPGGWSLWIDGTLQATLGNSYFAGMVFENPAFDFHTLNFDGDVALADAKTGFALNSVSPNLNRFKRHGGKIIQYHGWSDPGISAINSVNYYQRVVAAQAFEAFRQHESPLKETREFYRLFMAPGMLHCGGGPGPNSFGNGAVSGDAAHDVLRALDRWVERGVAPDQIIATKYVNNDPLQGVSRTRPLCPYPQAAQWTGRGSTDDAANFVCKTPHRGHGHANDDESDD